MTIGASDPSAQDARGDRRVLFGGWDRRLGETPFYRAALWGHVVDEGDVMAALSEVEDPELPVSIVDMGLIYDVRVTDEEVTSVEVDMTFTAMGCPAMDFMKYDVREAVLGVEDVQDVEINTVWDPPWTTDRMSEEARAVLQTAGVGV